VAFYGASPAHDGTVWGSSLGFPGYVVRLDPTGEFGFLESNDGQEVYFHRNSVLSDGFFRLRVGSRVTFAEEIGEKP